MQVTVLRLELIGVGVCPEGVSPPGLNQCGTRLVRSRYEVQRDVDVEEEHEHVHRGQPMNENTLILENRSVCFIVQGWIGGGHETGSPRPTETHVVRPQLRLSPE